MYYIYVIFSESLGKFYTGYTKNIKKRIKHHNLGLDRWSKRGIPWKLVYSEKFNDKTEAIKREGFLKSSFGRRLVRARIAKVVTARV